MISYCIAVCNEREDIEHLLTELFQSSQDEDEIIVLFDTKNGTESVEKYLDGIENYKLTVYKEPFDSNFADWKNLLNSFAKGEYIVNLDPDESLHGFLAANINIIIERAEADLILVPRINIVNGITPEDIKKYGWQLNEKGWIQFPDYQGRIYRNDPAIKWVGKVHERITGVKTAVRLPEEERFCLLHVKEIDRQRRQNEYYETLTEDVND